MATRGTHTTLQHAARRAGCGVGSSATRGTISSASARSLWMLMTCCFCQVLPDVTTDRWRYQGTTRKRGHNADVWMLRLEPNEGYGTYHSNYTFYVTKVSTVPHAELYVWR